MVIKPNTKRQLRRLFVHQYFNVIEFGLFSIIDNSRSYLTCKNFQFCRFGLSLDILMFSISLVWFLFQIMSYGAETGKMVLANVGFYKSKIAKS
jgi:hypothetical protein